MDPLGSRSYSPSADPWNSLSSSSSLHGVPCRPFISTAHIASGCRTLTASRISLASGGTAINRNTHGGITNRLSCLGNDAQLLRVPKTLQPQPLQRPNEPIQYATRAAFPETGSRVDNLYNCQDQTPELPRFHLSNFPPVGKGKLIIVCPAGSFLGLFI